ncbi:guanylate kinase [Cohnella sp. CFH 77786]|uniref:guanylate kinase n=1 Tax=Cohnella sp. CFH 77786 TaxID=2662265 RepID=UPI001C60E759|nr:AAA family ATPase [Cohnella sp. CFH 77786]
MNGCDIIVFTGTSGAGRKTIARLVSRALGYRQVVSATTRPPRNPNQPDSDYHYVSVQQFDKWAEEGGFIQTAEIDRNRYGVLKREMDDALGSGKGVSLVLNREGAEAVKRLYGDRVVRVFIYVDKQTVRERLESKGSKYDVIEAYLGHYTDEVTYRKKCELVVENVDLDSTVARIVHELGVLKKGNIE